MTSTSLFPLAGWIRCMGHETFEIRTVLEYLVVGSCLVPTELPLGDFRCHFIGSDSVPGLEPHHRPTHHHVFKCPGELALDGKHHLCADRPRLSAERLAQRRVTIGDGE